MEDHRRELDSCLLSQVEGLRAALESIAARDLGGTASLRKVIQEFMVAQCWEKNVLVSPSAVTNFPDANYKLDGFYRGNVGTCQAKHGLALELCFDNRQAIGTNFLKLQTIKKNFANTVGGSVVGLFVSGSRDLLRAGNWDAAVGASEEYELAFLRAYSLVIDVPTILFRLHNDSLKF